MNTQITEKLKSVLQGEERDLVDPYVEITLCDQKVISIQIEFNFFTQTFANKAKLMFIRTEILYLFEM